MDDEALVIFIPWLIIVAVALITLYFSNVKFLSIPFLALILAITFPFNIFFSIALYHNFPLAIPAITFTVIAIVNYKKAISNSGNITIKTIIVDVIWKALYVCIYIFVGVYLLLKVWSMIDRSGS